MRTKKADRKIKGLKRKVAPIRGKATVKRVTFTVETEDTCEVVKSRLAVMAKTDGKFEYLPGNGHETWVRLRAIKVEDVGAR